MIYKVSPDLWIELDILEAMFINRAVKDNKHISQMCFVMSDGNKYLADFENDEQCNQAARDVQNAKGMC